MSSVHGYKNTSLVVFRRGANYVWRDGKSAIYEMVDLIPEQELDYLKMSGLMLNNTLTLKPSRKIYLNALVLLGTESELVAVLFVAMTQKCDQLIVRLPEGDC